MIGDGSKVWCCKEQYCIESWNVRSMNQGKLEVVKQETARVNVDILGIGELKWTGMKVKESDEGLPWWLQWGRLGFSLWVRKIAWKKEWLPTHSSILS